MAEEYTCIECENLYDDTDGDTDERLCNKCGCQIYKEDGVIDVDKEVWKSRYEESNHHLDLMVECYGMEALVELVENEKKKRRNPDIHRSSTAHYPDWDKKKKEYVVPPNQRRKQ